MVAAARAAAVALPLPLPGFGRAPKPVFRPAPRPAPAAPRERAPRTLGERGLAFVTGLPDHVWLDRLVRGRVWIPLLGVLLAGIVAAQVEILKLGASMGRALEQSSTLTTQNEQLRGTVAALADDQRIERLALGMGLVLPPPGAVGYLPPASGGDVSAALANIHMPDAAAFVTMAARNGGTVTGPGTSTLPPPAGTPALPPPATTSTSTNPAGTASGYQATPTLPAGAGTTGAQSTAATSQTTPAASGTQTPTPQTATQQTPPQPTGTQPAPGASTQASGTSAGGGAAIQPSGASQSGGG